MLYRKHEMGGQEPGKEATYWSLIPNGLHTRQGLYFCYGRQVRICFSQRAEVEEKVVAQKVSDDEAPRLTSSCAIDQGAKEIT